MREDRRFGAHACHEREMERIGIDSFSRFTAELPAVAVPGAIERSREPEAGLGGPCDAADADLRRLEELKQARKRKIVAMSRPAWI